MSENSKPSALSQFWFRLKRRRVKFIDPKQQSRLALEIILMVLALPVMFYMFMVTDLWTRVFFGQTQGMAMKAFFETQLGMMAKAWPVIVVCLVFIVFISIFFTHKIFGPMYRFQKVLEAKLRGEGDQFFVLRRGDYFQDFSEVIKLIALSKVEVPKDVELRAESDEVFDMDEEASDAAPVKEPNADESNYSQEGETVELRHDEDDD